MALLARASAGWPAAVWAQQPADGRVLGCWQVCRYHR